MSSSRDFGGNSGGENMPNQEEKMEEEQTLDWSTMAALDNPGSASSITNKWLAMAQGGGIEAAKRGGSAKLSTPPTPKPPSTPKPPLSIPSLMDSGRLGPSPSKSNDSNTQNKLGFGLASILSSIRGDEDDEEDAEGQEEEEEKEEKTDEKKDVTKPEDKNRVTPSRFTSNWQKDLYDPTKPTDEPATSSSSTWTPSSAAPPSGPPPTVKPFVLKSLMSAPMRPLLSTPPTIGFDSKEDESKKLKLSSPIGLLEDKNDDGEGGGAEVDGGAEQSIQDVEKGKDDAEDIYDPMEPTEEESTPPPWSADKSDQSSAPTTKTTTTVAPDIDADDSNDEQADDDNQTDFHRDDDGKDEETDKHDDDDKEQPNGTSTGPVVADYASSTSLTSQEEPDDQQTSMEDLMAPMDQGLES